MRLRPVVIALVMSWSAIAGADDGSNDLERGLPKIVPGKGLETAPVRAPRWCSAVKVADPKRWAWEVKSRLDQWNPKGHNEIYIVKAAELLCSAPAGNPVAARVAATVEQMWINATGLTDAEAVASLAARANPDVWEEESKQFCESIPEVSKGDEQWFSIARRHFFGCSGTAQWIQSPSIQQLDRHLDGAVASDPILHLTWVRYRLGIDLDKTVALDRSLPGYVLDQFDLAIDRLQFNRALDVAPSRSNRYAHIIASESLAHERMRAAELEAAVAAKTASDPVWKELLVTAPRRGHAEWLAAAARHKAALASKDCVVIRKELTAMFKKFKHDKIEQLTEQLSSDPIAGLLLSRMSGCPGATGLVQQVRVVTGPRMGAYFATLDAIGALKGRAPFGPREIADYMGERHLSDGNDRAMSYHGIVSAIGKVKGAVKVTFIQHKQQVMQQECVEGNKVDRIDPDSGKVTYRRVCHNTGLKWMSADPDPIVIDPMIASGIKVGAFVRFLGVGKGALPLEVYTDKSAKKLVAYYGFALE